MKYSLLICSICLLLVPSDSAGAENEAFRVMTFNIRYGTAPDGDNTWSKRKALVWEFLDSEKPQILGLQEALYDQWSEIVEKFPQYGAVGVGRGADGGGEYSTLLYDRTRFDLLSADTFWLSDTPEVRGSTSWGNDLTRICTWARLLDRTNNQTLTVLNTHWDHQSQPSRLKSGEQLASRVQEIVANEPVIVMGDFNVGPLNPARQPLTAAGLRDSFVDVHPDQVHEGTFHAFTGKATSDKIDAILVSKQWRVTAAEIFRNVRDGVYLSDHYPVSATLELKSTP
jgi:endonuclease/exonuclease/phosphatase family metal-dependent hydrolase